jgi:hypothetical protein
MASCAPTPATVAERGRPPITLRFSKREMRPRTTPYGETRPLEFSALFGYTLGNRDGIDNWHCISTALRRSVGRKLAPVRAGNGAIEKNIEVQINPRFKTRGLTVKP